MAGSAEEKDAIREVMAATVMRSTRAGSAT
jgi:hypothetical protein